MSGLKAEIKCSCDNDCLSLTSDPEVLAVAVVSKFVVLDLRRPVRSLLSGCAFGLMSVMSSFSDAEVRGFVGSINGGSSLGALLVIVIAMLSSLSGNRAELSKWLGDLRKSGKEGADFSELRLDRGCVRSGKSWSNDGFFCGILSLREERRSDNPDSPDNSPSLFWTPPSSSSVG